MIVGGPVGGGEMTVKLTDFGIARAVEQTRITQVGSVVGTAAYLSPEQVRGEEATPATDVYALGVVLYQFLTGRLPYEGSSLAELAVRQQNEKPLPPSTYNDEVPETLGAAVLRALEGDPAAATPAPSELAGGLRLGLAGRGRDRCRWRSATGRPAVLGGETAATRRLDRHRPDRVPRAVAAASPEPVAPSPCCAAAAAACPPRTGLPSSSASCRHRESQRSVVALRRRVIDHDLTSAAGAARCRPPIDHTIAEEVDRRRWRPESAADPLDERVVEDLRLCSTRR